MNKSIIKSTLAIALFAITFTSCAKPTSKTTAPTKNTETVATKADQTTPIRKVDVKTFKTEIEGKKVQLIDVRTPKEFKVGHLENADNVNVFDKNFMEQMAKYKKEEDVYVYCRSGGRSMKAARMLKAAGYNVINMNGGFTDWSANGFKSVK